MGLTSGNIFGGQARRKLTFKQLPSRPSFDQVSGLLKASYASETSPCEQTGIEK